MSTLALLERELVQSKNLVQLINAERNVLVDELHEVQDQLCATRVKVASLEHNMELFHNGARTGLSVQQMFEQVREEERARSNQRAADLEHQLAEARAARDNDHQQWMIADKEMVERGRVIVELRSALADERAARVAAEAEVKRLEGLIAHPADEGRGIHVGYEDRAFYALTPAFVAEAQRIRKRDAALAAAQPKEEEKDTP